jgi:hypothetical protein
MDAATALYDQHIRAVRPSSSRNCANCDQHQYGEWWHDLLKNGKEKLNGLVFFNKFSSIIAAQN